MQRLPPSHSWKFRKGQGEDSSLLLVHQTDNQKRLLSQYGNNLCTLDAVYKTTKYSLPTFFIVIRADTTHQVVGSFIVSEETHNAIEEAVRVIREWNPSWNPLYWMTDCCAAVIDALENVFPGMPSPAAVKQNPVGTAKTALSNFSIFLTLAVFLIIALGIFSDFFPACI